MKARTWERIARRQVVPALGEAFAAHDHLIYRRPIEHVLVGMNIDTVYEASRLHVEAVVMPLFSPRDHLTYFVPRDLGALDVQDGAELSPNQLEIFTDGLDFLQSHATPRLLLEDGSWKRADDVVRLEVEAYSYLLLGSLDTSQTVLEHIVRLRVDPDIEWEQLAQQRCAHILALIRGNPAYAQDQLIEWEDDTLNALGLARE